MAHSMDDAELRRFLSEGTRTGKLAWTSADGQALVTPIWFVVDEDADDVEVVFNTGADTAKGRAMRRDPRVSLVVDLEEPPYAYVRLTGLVDLGEELDEMRRWATKIGARYMGADRAEEFGRRNAVPGELLVRLTPTRVVSRADMTG